MSEMNNQPRRRYGSPDKPMKRGGGGPRGGRLLEKPKNLKVTLSRVLRYIGKRKILLYTAFLFVFLGICSSLASSSMLQPIIDDFLYETELGLSVPERMKGLINGLFVMAALYIANALTNFIQQKLMLVVAQEAIKDVRNDLFTHMQRLPLSFFDRNTTGQIMSRYINDVDTLHNAIQQTVITLFSSTINIIGILAMMFYRSWLMTLIVLAATPLIFVITIKVAKTSSKYFRSQQRDLGEVNGYIEEIISGQKVVKVFGYEKRANAEFEMLNENLRKSATTAQTYGGIMMPMTRNINNIIYALVAALGGVLTVTGNLSVGALVVFLQFTRRFGQPINEVANQYNSAVTALAGAERIFAIIDTEPEAADAENAYTLKREDGTFYWVRGSERIEAKGDVRFEDVTFGYVPEKTVLKNVSLYAKPGQKIAFVGSTGAGKTTVSNLIPRFYDIENGRITVDGIEIKNIARSSLRLAISMVLQDTHLFTGTVRENIRYGRPDATDEDIERAARLSSAYSFISRLPQGFDTMIEGDGANLSQGQRQLLNITRAAVAESPILILDEATSSVDTRTEKLIEQGLDALMQNRTTFVIAHRLSTVRNSNAIMVMEQGTIIERGTHEQLLEQKGRYWQLYNGTIELD